ncbi:hypothetical protein HMPREF0972_01743 [Actinomyces sp. oral taxon 848 str. F0332]|nr:hypothetical protein HMPREF0972_01743 [Actinomyces sp. oral taxon 848 str. F0332]
MEAQEADACASGVRGNRLDPDCRGGRASARSLSAQKLQELRSSTGRTSRVPRLEETPAQRRFFAAVSTTFDLRQAPPRLEEASRIAPAENAPMASRARIDKLGP